MTWPVVTRGRLFQQFLGPTIQERRLSLAYAHHQSPTRTQDVGHNTVIILHGLFGSKQNNRSIGKALARRLNCSVYAVDLRNHGESPHNAYHNYIAMAGDVQQFVEERRLGQVTLIGHSM